MKSLTDKIAGYGIGFDRGNYQRTLNHILLGAMLSLAYPSENSNSSINYPVIGNLPQYHIRLSEKSSDSNKRYAGKNNEVLSLEDITDENLMRDVKIQLSKVDPDDFEKIFERISKYNSLILSYSQVHNLDDYLVASVIYHESSGNPKAVSPKKALGLMQVTHDAAKEVKNKISNYRKSPTRKEILSPEKNIAFGTTYLSNLIEMYEGNVMLGLAAYNLGPTRLSGILKKKKIHPKSADWNDIKHLLPRETREYVPKVLSGVLKMRENYASKS